MPVFLLERENKMDFSRIDRMQKLRERHEELTWRLREIKRDTRNGEKQIRVKFESGANEFYVLADLSCGIKELEGELISVEQELKDLGV
jgi:nitrogen fixation/metabolism regulation signal transduction histidine kinase